MPGRETKVARGAVIPPLVLGEIVAPSGTIQLLEWDWSDGIEYTAVETELMVELSLPPFFGFAMASFPTIAPGVETAMGTLFIRYPGIAIQTLARAGTLRLVRCTFAPARRDALLSGRHPPSLAMMQTLMAIRSDALLALMRQARRELDHAGQAASEAGEALLALLALEVERLLDRNPNPVAGGRLAPWQFKRINERLANGASRPGVPELAALCGISVRHLHRQFLNLTGVTISDYIEYHLIQRAKIMLAQGDLAVRDVALANGFDHPNSFSRAFRRATGQTPLQYRRRKHAYGATMDDAESAK